MRLAWYAGASTALAGAVVASAFYQRANFYAAMVHLAQSGLSLMVLVNLVFVIYSTFMYGLQRLCFGPLRPVEIEQLYEKAWFAVTETCLAMTIFREEVGAFFLVMFTALVTGKVWGWIGEGRVEILEQQPPANPRLFHTRLSISLLLSVAYDIWILSYAVNTVVQQARPTMMVMFLFEFAILAVCSLHTAFRYLVSVTEQHIIKTQTRQRLHERRRQIRAEREEILRRRAEGEAEGEAEGDAELPNEDDVDEMDIEVPGWESKGQWVLTLDLVADFVKLSIYTAFFGVLLTFYGLPIHIIRDWFLTTRSFLKRLSALIRYRQALKDMNQYPDATVEDLGRDETCIICREEMRPWDPNDASQLERSRAKKLPCGHILHLGCLKSWLERQQVCPTCRRPVTREGQQQQPPRNGEALVFRFGQPPAGQPPAGAAPEERPNNPNRGVRMFNFGPLRLGIAQGGVEEMQDMAQRLGIPAEVINPALPAPAVAAPVPDSAALNLDQIRAQLLETAQRVQQELAVLNNTAHELNTLNLLVGEIARLRQLQQAAPAAVPGGTPGAGPGPQLQHTGPTPFIPSLPLPLPQPHAPNAFVPRPPTVTRHVGTGYGAAIPAGSADLPEGVVLPPGWSLLPLQRLDEGAAPAGPGSSNTQPPPPNTLQEMLQALAPGSPRQSHSRGASPAARTRVPDQADRGSTLADALRQRAASPPVTAPTPVAPPNWGGSSQLFSGRSQGSLFGYQRDTSTPGSEAGEGSAQPTATTSNPTPERQEGASSSTDDTTGSKNKGKAKAATVEDMDDDEWEDE